MKSAKQQFWRDFAANLLLAAIYFVAAKLGLLLALEHPSATAVWPPTGIALACLVLYGYRFWPGVLLGAFIANATTKVSLLAAAEIGVGNTIEAMLGAWLVLTFAGGRNVLNRVSHIASFAILAASFSTAICATIGIIVLWSNGFAPREQLSSIWLTWWLGDMTSDLLVAPLLLVWLGRSFSWAFRLQFITAGLLLVLSVFISFIVFGDWSPDRTRHYPLQFLVIPLVLCMAYRFEQRGAVTGAAAVAAVALWGTLHRQGPFAVPRLNDSLILLQAFAATLALTALVLAALVSQRRIAEEGQSDAERIGRRRFAELSAIYHDAPVGLCFVDTDLRYVKINERLAALNGRPVAEHIGRTISEIVPEMTESVKSIKQVMATGVPISDLELKGETSAEPGVKRDWLVSHYPVKDPTGRLLGVNTVVQDITERKKVEEELLSHREQLEHLVNQRTAELEFSHQRLRLSERMAAMGTLSAGIGHDMGNLLFPIKMRLEAMQSANPPPEWREHLDAIAQCVSYLQSLTRGLRLFAQDPEQATVGSFTDLAAWQADVGSLYKSVLPRSVQFQILLAPNLPKVAIAPHALTQAILNLVNNAKDAIGLDRAGHVFLRAESGPQEGFVRITLQDDGPGMSVEVKARALEPFFTTKTRRLSTGLGLSLVHGIVTAVGGTIEIQSPPLDGSGVGTAVFLNLPAATESLQSSGSALQRSTNNAPVAAISVGNPRTSALLMSVLESMGYSVMRTNGDPGPSDLWITDPSLERLPLAQKFLEAESGRKLVLVGDPSPEWQNIRAYVIDPSKKLSAMREVLRGLAPRDWSMNS